MPKRKLEDSDSAADTPSDVNPLRSETPPRPQSETDESSSFSAVTDSSVDVPSTEEPRPKKKKKSVNFDKVTVYYFPRTQGFTCVPSEGGSTLGMTGSHSYVEDFTVSAYAREMKRIHKIILKEQQQSSKMIPSNRAAFLRSVEEEDTDSESDSESDFEVDEYFFLQPVPIRQRRLMLRAAGIRKINSHERDDCRQIRLSREICGCQCKVFCDPESCSCSVAGIKCQVDRLSFPCGCSKDGCGNVAGRIEFNPIRVRTHFIHTLMRIELENKGKECHTLGDGGNKPLLSISDSSAANKESDSEDKDDGDEEEAKNKKNKDNSIDLADYNSNERGSCRDCQNSEVCQVMMQEAQYASMEAEHHNAVQQFGRMDGLQANGHVEALPRHLLFNDSDDEMYSAESTSLYGYKQEESSYSETSECSSESSANFDDNDYQKSFQSLSSFDEETNQEYCASGSSSVGTDNVTQCQPSQMQQQQQQQHNNNNNNNHISNSKTLQPFSSSNNNNNNNHLPNGLSQKYIDLNSSSSNPSPVYKLEPVSHLMNRLDNSQSPFSGQPNGHSRFDGQSNGHNVFDRQTNGFSGQSNGRNVFAQSNGHRAFNSQNTFNNQSNSHNTSHSQSNGHSTFNGQPNGRNAFENHSNNHNAFNSQSHNAFNTQSSDRNAFNTQSSDRNAFNTQSSDRNAFNTQSSDRNTFNTQSSDRNTFNTQSSDRNAFNTQSSGRNTFNTQSSDRNTFNSQNTFGSQSNGPNPFSSPSNGTVPFNSQSNGPNQFSNQSNGPVLFGNQSNNHRSFENQPTQPSSHSTSNWSGNQSRSIHQSSFFDEPISIYTSLTDTTTDQLATNCPAISSHMNSYGIGNHQLDFNPHQGTDTSKVGDMQNQPEAAYSSYSMDDSHNTATSSAMSTSDQSLISSFFPSNTTESDLIASSSGSSATSVPSATEDLQMFSEQESCSSAFQEETCRDLKSNKDSSRFQKTPDSGNQNFGEIIKESIVETVSA